MEYSVGRPAFLHRFVRSLIPLNQLHLFIQCGLLKYSGNAQVTSLVDLLYKAVAYSASPFREKE